MKNNNILTITLVAVVIAAIAFFIGMQYQKSQLASNAGSGQYAQGGQGGQNNRQGRSRGGFGSGTVGKILSQDANSITVQLLDGSSKIVNISSTTTFSKTSPASKSDLTTGQMVAASGTSNSDGSITADRIQLNPMLRQRDTQPTQSQ